MSSIDARYLAQAQQLIDDGYISTTDERNVMELAEILQRRARIDKLTALQERQEQAEYFDDDGNPIIKEEKGLPVIDGVNVKVLDSKC